VITNCSYDVWNYPINRVIKSGTHYLLSRYQDTRDNIKNVMFIEFSLTVSIDWLYNHVCCVDGNLTLRFAYDTQQDARWENIALLLVKLPKHQREDNFWYFKIYNPINFWQKLVIYKTFRCNGIALYSKYRYSLFIGSSRLIRQWDLCSTFTVRSDKYYNYFFC
jgi:hypothetical protein